MTSRPDVHAVDSPVQPRTALQHLQGVLDGLLAMTEGLNRAESATQVVDAALRGATRLPGVKSAWIRLRGADSRYRMAGTCGVSDAQMPMVTQDFVCACQRHYSSVVAHWSSINILCDRGDGDVCGRIEPMAHASVPLWAGSRLLGLMNLQGPLQGHFTDDDLRVLTGLGNQIGLALERAELLERLRGQADASAQKARLLMEHANDGVLLLDAQGVIVEANHRAVEITGRASADLVGRAFTVFLPPEEIEIGERFLVTLQEHGSLTIPDLHARQPSGRRISLEMSASVVKFGSEQGTLVLVRDSTDRLRQETKQRLAQKMDAVGRLAGGVAHDFNNILTVIQGYVQLMQLNLKSDDPNHAPVGEILKASRSAVGLTRQLSTLSRSPASPRQVVSLNTLLADQARTLRPLLREDIELVVHTRAEPGHILGDSGTLEQMLLSLALNARDAMSTSGRLTLSTEDVTLRSTFAEQAAGRRAGQYVLVTVSDTGCGMSDEVLGHLFEPFFTTKEKGKGTGLGLAQVYGIVRQHEGTIDVESLPGRGTTFRIYLPRTDQVQTVPAPKAAGLPLARAGETVLVVEDEPSVRALACDLLRGLGYQVASAVDGAVGLEWVRANRGALHLVLSDVVMPNLDGFEMVRRIRELRPDLPVLFFSGYPDPGRVGEMPAFSRVLPKPLKRDLLAHAVRDLIDRK